MKRSASSNAERNARGNSRDRRARRLYLLSPEAGFGGDGQTVACWECHARVDYESLIVDRIVPGIDGGRYIRSNIRPQCKPCSDWQGYKMGIGR